MSGATRIEGVFGLTLEEADQLAALYFEQFPWAGDSATLEEMLPTDFFALVD